MGSAHCVRASTLHYLLAARYVASCLTAASDGRTCPLFFSFRPPQLLSPLLSPTGLPRKPTAAPTPPCNRLPHDVRVSLESQKFVLCMVLCYFYSPAPSKALCMILCTFLFCVLYARVPSRRHYCTWWRGVLCRLGVAEFIETVGTPPPPPTAPTHPPQPHPHCDLRRASNQWCLGHLVRFSTRLRVTPATRCAHTFMVHVSCRPLHAVSTRLRTMRRLRTMGFRPLPQGRTAQRLCLSSASTAPSCGPHFDATHARHTSTRHSLPCGASSRCGVSTRRYRFVCLLAANATSTWRPRSLLTACMWRHRLS